jgi:hypothetical protein
MKYMITPLSAVVHGVDESAIFGEYRTIVSIEDDGDGIYIQLDQDKENRPGRIKLNGLEELHKVVEAATKLMKAHEKPAEIVETDDYKCPNCPAEKLVELYHKQLPELPRIVDMSSTRLKHLAARWRQVVAEEKMTRQEGLNWWVKFFGMVKESPFLMGTNNQNWRASLDWLIVQDNFLKVIERKYHREVS